MTTFINCPECRAYVDTHPHIKAACASVGIERGASTGQMLQTHMDVIHQDHQPRPRRRRRVPWADHPLLILGSFLIAFGNPGAPFLRDWALILGVFCVAAHIHRQER